ncbi:mechanosensitive ion channel domain-containing protein [Maribacter sp. 2307ULW6-5]|uniref:mechanosensitive ion channel domain-containing protein n=1 Tax=Maribacter sp. 2307ULW6-5 TaxID=3386275 RepID=UPI0039BCC755
MDEFITNNGQQLLTSAVIIAVAVTLRFLFTKTARKVGKLGDLNPARTNLVIKYISLAVSFTALGAITFVWGVNYEDLGLLLSSVFAVIGVALFAQWSILSNITAGVIIFFSFPFKIGNRIKILDKDLVPSEQGENDIFIIEDIKAFHMHLRRSNGEMLTYPNNMVLQKGVILVATYKEESNLPTDQV